MRRFFYDTEFIERPCTIDLISIGIVAETGETFYAICNEFDESKASPWVVENVIAKLTHQMEWLSKDQIANRILTFLQPSEEDPVELWGYYADYDHVVLCWLFGTMMQLPKGMPMFTMDLKQLLESYGNPRIAKNENAHDALQDALWIRKTYRFLQGHDGL